MHHHASRPGATAALTSLLGALFLALAPAASAVVAEPPFAVTEQITDRAGALDDVPEAQGHLDALYEEHQVELWVVFVDSFNGDTGARWTQQTFETSGLGGDDVLLAVNVEDQTFGLWTTLSSGLGPDDIERVQTEYVEEPVERLAWDQVVKSTARGIANGPDDDRDRVIEALVMLAPVVALLAILLILHLVERRRERKFEERRRRALPDGEVEPRETIDVSNGELKTRAGSALVAVDDAIRASADELAFAEAQFGRQATQRFADALERARADVGEAFRLQLEIDARARTGEDIEHDGLLRSKILKVLALARSADTALDEQEAQFARLGNLEAAVPSLLTDLRGRLREVEHRVSVAEQELVGLRATHPEEVWASLPPELEQARALLSSAQALVDTGERHVAAGERPAAISAARAAEEAIGQAAARLEVVLGARSVLADAARALDTALASISADIRDAERLHAADQVAVAAVADARVAIDAGTQARHGGDVLSALSSLEQAEGRLDDALAPYRHQEETSERRRALLGRRREHVTSLVRRADGVVHRHRGAFGPRQRAQHAEMHRLLDQAHHAVDGDHEAAHECFDKAEELARWFLDAQKRALGLPRDYGRASWVRGAVRSLIPGGRSGWGGSGGGSGGGGRSGGPDVGGRP